MTVHAAPSSVFPGGGLQPELFLRSEALQPSEATTAVFNHWPLSCQDGHRCRYRSDKPEQTRHEHASAGTANAKPPVVLRKAPLPRVIVASG